jgi:hypothetical protein
MQKKFLSVVIFSLGPLACACGEGTGGEDPLAIYAGSFQVLELFQDQSGASCPNPPADSQNQVQITVKKNDFIAAFSQRWGKMVGQINADTSFLAVNSEPYVDLSLKFTGTYPDQDHFQSVMREIIPGCTRQRTLQGTRTGVSP